MSASLALTSPMAPRSRAAAASSYQAGATPPGPRGGGGFPAPRARSSAKTTCDSLTWRYRAAPAVRRSVSTRTVSPADDADSSAVARSSSTGPPRASLFRAGACRPRGSAQAVSAPSASTIQPSRRAAGAARRAKVFLGSNPRSLGSTRSVSSASSSCAAQWRAMSSPPPAGAAQARRATSARSDASTATPPSRGAPSSVARQSDSARTRHRSRGRSSARRSAKDARSRPGFTAPPWGGRTVSQTARASAGSPRRQTTWTRRLPSSRLARGFRGGASASAGGAPSMAAGAVALTAPRPTWASGASSMASDAGSHLTTACEFASRGQSSTVPLRHVASSRRTQHASPGAGSSRGLSGPAGASPSAAAGASSTSMSQSASSATRLASSARRKRRRRSDGSRTSASP
mmetsp:Transcript_5876/g.20076  ORF Transcript_5876/g.20076 Transcript_5876/m.20076 type:complete len:404 (+) Transcript_5876:1265-2476(+)